MEMKVRSRTQACIVHPKLPTFAFVFSKSHLYKQVGKWPFPLLWRRSGDIQCLVAALERTRAGRAAACLCTCIILKKKKNGGNWTQDLLQLTSLVIKMGNFKLERKQTEVENGLLCSR